MYYCSQCKNSAGHFFWVSSPQVSRHHVFCPDSNLMFNCELDFHVENWQNWLQIFISSATSYSFYVLYFYDLYINDAYTNHLLSQWLVAADHIWAMRRIKIGLLLLKFTNPRKGLRCLVYICKMNKLLTELKSIESVLWFIELIYFCPLAIKKIT